MEEVTMMGSREKHQMDHGNDLGPELSFSPSKKVRIWVQTKSVWDQNAILRCIMIKEVLGMWDYKAKLFKHNLAHVSLETLAD